MFEQVKQVLQLFAPAPYLKPIPHPSGNGHIYAMHRDYVAKVDPGPEIARPAHVLHSVDSFARFLNREWNVHRLNEEGATVLVDERAIVASFDSYDPNAAHVECSLRHHPLWSKWRSLEDRWHSSADMFAHLRALQSTFGSATMRVDGKPKLVPMGPTIVDSLRRVQVTTGGDIRVERGPGGMATVVAKTADTTVHTDLADEWPLHLAIFEGAPDLKVDAQVLVTWRYDKDTKDLQFKVSIPLAAMAENAARQLVVERIETLMPWAIVGAGAVLTKCTHPV